MFKYVHKLIFIYICNVYLSAGITGKIAGNVTEQATGDPLAGVNIHIEGSAMETVTDGSGDYLIIGIPPGRHNVQASLKGYQSIVMTDVLISSDHTSVIDFSLILTEFDVEPIRVQAKREVIRMDQTSSIITVQSEDILGIPTISDLEGYLNTQVGIENMKIRGGGLDQTELLVNGLSVNNYSQNRPMTSLINLSAIQELNIIKSGFNAEYGNVRSGVIDVITKSGDPNSYHGSFDIRKAPPQRKHGGRSLMDTMNWYLRPYFDPDVAFVGTPVGWAGDENKDLRETYPEWEGWDSWVDRLAEQGINQTPVEAQDMFQWLHAAEGSDRLGQKVNRYSHKPDWLYDMSFGGPLPYIGKYLGNMTFFLSYKDQAEMFALPMPRDNLKEQNYYIKLSSNPTRSLSLKYEILYGEIQSIRGKLDPESRDKVGQFLTDATDPLYMSKYGAGSRNIFYEWSVIPMDVFRTMQGLSIDHVLNPKTFYSFKLSFTNVQFKSTTDLIVYRNAYDEIHHEETKDNILRYFGDVPVDESPYGYSIWENLYYMFLYMGGTLRPLGGGGERDWSSINTFQAKFDITSQINTYNQIKAGFLYNYDDINTHFANMSEFDITGNFDMKWHQFPYRWGVYIQDKIEIEDMVVNAGLRLDTNEPNTEWYTVDRYHKYFGNTKRYKGIFHKLMKEEGLLEKAKGDINISPRLGISFALSQESKIYFNYGHFYSMATSTDMYTVQPGAPGQGIVFLGNPSSKMPRTIAYELGYEHDIHKGFVLNITGYYKNSTRETGEVQYINYGATVDYQTIENNYYADVLGGEVRLNKRFGKWIKGWINYDYRVESWGYIGEPIHYEFPEQQPMFISQNPRQVKPKTRPLVNANICFSTPENLGPVIAGIYPAGGWNLNLFWWWKAGRYETWDPLYKGFKDNIQWKSEYYSDMRLEKRTSISSVIFSIFVDIFNVFDLRYISSRGFGVGNDYRNYMNSLQLKMYNDLEYYFEGLPSNNYDGNKWNDEPGDRKSEDKPYINMPDRKFMTYLNPRRFEFGIRIDF